MAVPGRFFSEMIAILSDIHGNLPALRAVLQSAIKMGCKRIISLGDVVGYYSQPNECIDLLREHYAINIMGNHDSYIINGMSARHSKIVSEIIDYQRKVISPDQLQWLSQSNISLIEESNYFSHGGWTDPQNQYLYKVTLADIPAGAVNFFTGHTHVQVLFEFGNKKYCNPGSVGQPRDGDPRAAFAILENNSIHLQRVVYDIDETANLMHNAGFPARYYENLYIGSQIGGRIDKITKGF